MDPRSAFARTARVHRHVRSMMHRFLCSAAATVSLLGCGTESATPDDTTATSAGSTSDPSGTTTAATSGASVTVSSGDAGDTTQGGEATDTSGGTPASLPEAYIQAAPYPHLVIEVDAVDGWAPRAETATQIPASLESILAKPAGVEAILDETLPPGASDGVWTFAELDALAAETLDLEVDVDTVKMHVLFLDGRYMAEDPNAVILGLAWHRSEIAIFAETIDQLCRGQVGPGLEERLCAGTERSVWVHEIGHLLGLVDNGIPMLTSREDPDHAHHDINEDCVMFWAAERENAVQKLAMQLQDLDIAYLDFDDACLADIADVRDQ
jgi:hypothetical protein